jgi:hypothetical protein
MRHMRLLERDGDLLSGAGPHLGLVGGDCGGEGFVAGVHGLQLLEEEGGVLEGVVEALAAVWGVGGFSCG